MKNTLVLQKLVFGDRNVFIFEDDLESTLDLISPTKAFNFAMKLNKIGYGISNSQHLFSYTKKGFKKFKNQLMNLIDSNTKEGMILRKTFAESEDLTDYTDEEWMAILAQYAITYSWSNEFALEFNKTAESVLNNYMGTLDLVSISTIDNTVEKIFAIGDRSDLIKIVTNILESKTVLRAQQLKILEEVSSDILKESARNANITIKETLVRTMNLLSHEHLDFALLKSASDVLRFIVSAYAGVPVEGQINKTILKSTKIRIPTSARKMLLNNLEEIANAKGYKFLCEDMFSYESFWKVIARYLRFGKNKNSRARYPLYHSAIDLLYNGDRSWTFNGRYSAAKEKLDYEAAFVVAKEKPGFLLRNLVEFIRMTKGKRLPVKINSNSNIKPNNPFHKALLNESTKIHQRVIDKDAIDLIFSEDFSVLLDKNLNTKLAWQLVEQLKDKSLFEDVFDRNVQGIEVEYSTPIPAVDKTIAKKVREIILKSIKRKLKDKDKNVYLDDDSYGYKLQYSGRDSTEISYAGEFLTPGTELNLIDLARGKNIEYPILRLGVVWRGKRSTDLDHSLTLDNRVVVYYGKPVYRVNNRILIVSSGDITSCADFNGKFSTELVDIDLVSVSNHGVKKMFNSFINYSGSINIGELECYTFISIIDKSKRIMEGSKVLVDLSKQDYAIRIDPDNKDKTGSYIGCSIDLKNNVIKVLSIPVKTASGHYSNAVMDNKKFEKAISNAKVDGLTIDYAINKVFNTVSHVSDAGIVISRKPADELGITDGTVLLHPGRNQEQINNLLFK